MRAGTGGIELMEQAPQLTDLPVIFISAYARARRGEIAQFTGIDSPYEAPENPDVHLDTAAPTPDRTADSVLRSLDEP